MFSSLDQVRTETWKFLLDYNEDRPHDALDDLTPIEYLINHAETLLLNDPLDGEAYDVINISLSGELFRDWDGTGAVLAFSLYWV